MEPDPVYEAHLRHRIVARLEEDATGGGLRELEHYRALLPGREILVEEEYAAFVAGEDRGSSEAPGLTQIGPYEVLERLGGGGMGDVFLCRDPALTRRVAVKVMRWAAIGDTRSLERFRREAAAAARIRHPGVCEVHAFGDVGGVPYLAMRFVEGPSLAARIAAAGENHGLPAREAAKLAAQVAEALHACHEAGVVHRDVKPSNVLIEDGERAVLTDFGVARLGDAAPGLTASREAMGTPAYMSPEQAAGQPIDARTDVYGLGVTLYEMLTGRRAFPQDSSVATLAAVQEGRFVAPSRIAPGMPRDLEAICLRACELEPRHRYGSAAELAEDLERYLAGRPVDAQPVGWLGRIGRRARRQPGRAALVLVGIIVAAIAFSFLVAAALDWSSRAARHRARERLTEAQTALREGDFPRARALLAAVDPSRLNGDEKRWREVALPICAAIGIPVEITLSGILGEEEVIGISHRTTKEGHPRLLFATRKGLLEAAWMEGHLDVTHRITLPVPLYGNEVVALAALDLDGDGEDDIAETYQSERPSGAGGPKVVANFRLREGRWQSAYEEVAPLKTRHTLGVYSNGLGTLRLPGKRHDALIIPAHSIQGRRRLGILSGDAPPRWIVRGHDAFEISDHRCVELVGAAGESEVLLTGRWLPGKDSRGFGFTGYSLEGVERFHQSVGRVEDIVLPTGFRSGDLPIVAYASDREESTWTFGSHGAQLATGIYIAAVDAGGVWPISGAPVPARSGENRPSIRHLATGDLDGNGRDELVATLETADSRLLIGAVEGPAHLELLECLRLGRTPLMENLLLDLDGDGDDEIVRVLPGSCLLVLGLSGKRRAPAPELELRSARSDPDPSWIEAARFPNPLLARARDRIVQGVAINGSTEPVVALPLPGLDALTEARIVFRAVDLQPQSSIFVGLWRTDSGEIRRPAPHVGMACSIGGTTGDLRIQVGPSAQLVEQLSKSMHETASPGRWMAVTLGLEGGTTGIEITAQVEELDDVTGEWRLLGGAVPSRWRLISPEGWAVAVGALPTPPDGADRGRVASFVVHLVSLTPRGELPPPSDAVLDRARRALVRGDLRGVDELLEGDSGEEATRLREVATRLDSSDPTFWDRALGSHPDDALIEELVAHVLHRGESLAALRSWPGEICWNRLKGSRQLDQEAAQQYDERYIETWLWTALMRSAGQNLER